MTGWRGRGGTANGAGGGGIATTTAVDEEAAGEGKEGKGEEGTCGVEGGTIYMRY